MNKQLHYYRTELKYKDILSYKIIGITTELILSKDIFKKNNDISRFLKIIFNISYKEYVMNSRTMIVARVSRLVYSLEKKDLDEIRKRLLDFVSSLINTTTENNVNTSQRKDLGKWIEGILNEN